MENVGSIEKLFSDWIKKQKAEPQESLSKTMAEGCSWKPEKFCKDGIIDEVIFQEEEVKVLFITNEANSLNYEDNILSDRRDDFKEYFQTGKDKWQGKMRERFCEMYKLIVGNRTLPTEKAATHFAFMNINKRGGGKNVGNGQHIKEYCEYYREEILEEICIINPDIIIWCGVKTYYLATAVLGAIQKKQKTLLEVNQKKIPVVRMWHPSYYQGKIAPLAGYDNKTVGKLMAKLNQELNKMGWK